MNLLIVDNNISYANNLKIILEHNITKIKSIQVVRDIKSVQNENRTTYTVVLFEPNEENLVELEKHFIENRTTQTKFVALTKELDTKQLLNVIQKGVSSIIYKTEKTEFIVDELNLILRGKVILPQKIITGIKEKISNRGIGKSVSPIKKMMAKYINN